MGRPPKEATKVFSVRVPRSVLERAEAKALEKGTTLGEILRSAIVKYGALESPTPPAAPMPPKLATLVQALETSVNEARADRHEHRADVAPRPKAGR